MRDSKLYQSLETLNVYELNRFGKFLNSPYFNRNQRMLVLFEQLATSLRQPDTPVTTKEEAWNSVMEEAEYDDRKFRKLCSDLLKLFEHFLAQERYESNPIHKANYLLEAIATKKIDKLYNSSMKTAKRLSQLQLERDASYYFFQYEFERNFYNIGEYEINRAEVSNIENIAENLDKFYLGEKLRYYCTVLSRQSIREHQYQMLFIDEIINHVETHAYEDVPPIQVYHQILKMYRDPDDRAHYDQLREIIRQDILKFPELEAKEIIDSALNYSIKQINKGKREFLREIFELYREALNKELLYVNQELSPWSFKNIVITGLRLKEFDWVEDFIHTYSEKLNDKYRANAMSFNLAQLYFYKQEYNKVIQLLQQVEYDDISYSLNSKTFLIGSYYELDEIDALDSMLDSFAAYLRRNKALTQSRKQLYKNMIYYVRQLTKVGLRDKKSLQDLKKAVEEEKALASKGWLLEKISELEGTSIIT